MVGRRRRFSHRAAFAVEALERRALCSTAGVVDFGVSGSGFLAGAGYVFFVGSGTEGNELWRTDGTRRGTVLVGDIRPGPQSPDIRMLAGTRAHFGAQRIN